MENKMIINLASFKTAKADIQDAWDNPLRENARITRDWIYTVDPETMNYCKVVFELMPDNYSLYDVFCDVMKSKDEYSLIQKSDYVNPYFDYDSETLHFEKINVHEQKRVSKTLFGLYLGFDKNQLLPKSLWN